jgi:putative nucleotidyltransferase with HDIG domain
MTEKDLETFKGFFSEYVKSFFLHAPEDRENILLKEEHTLMVCRTVRRLAEEEELEPEGVLLGETIGLFHDIGRFSQYARYRTFRDALSVNHGTLGAEILAEQGILKVLSPGEQRTVMNAVRFHNAFSLPALPDAEDLCYLRLVRDADKLDIWRIFLGFFEGGKREMTPAVGLDLTDSPGYSKEIARCVLEGRSVSHSAMKNVNDFTLLQLSWVYNLNFAASFVMLLENNYIGRLAALLPTGGELSEIESVLTNRISEMVKTASGKKGCKTGGRSQ